MLLEEELEDSPSRVSGKRKVALHSIFIEQYKKQNIKLKPRGRLL
jgi:hypothetical protein